MRRSAWAAGIALATGLSAIVALQGFSTVGWIKAVETLAIVAFGAAILFGAAGIVFVRLAGWKDPESEEEFDRVVMRAERLAADGLAVDPDEDEFLELDPYDDADFEELVRGREEPPCPDCGATKVSKQFSAFAVKAAAVGGGESSFRSSMGGGGGCCGGSCGC